MSPCGSFADSPVLRGKQRKDPFFGTPCVGGGLPLVSWNVGTADDGLFRGDRILRGDRRAIRGVLPSVSDQKIVWMDTKKDDRRWNSHQKSVSKTNAPTFYGEGTGSFVAERLRDDSRGRKQAKVAEKGETNCQTKQKSNSV